MTDQEPLGIDAEVDALLREARPVPAALFAADLEARLLPARSTSRFRPVRLGALAGAAGGLATVLVIAGFAGGGPLISGDSDAAKAKPGCRTVYVTKVEPVGEVVRKGDGTVTVETSQRPVTREQQRCR